MHAAFQSFLTGNYTYNYRSGPDVVFTEEQARVSGINCICLMHLLLKRLFDAVLPGNLRILEMYADNPYFTGVRDTDELMMGDIAFFGRRTLPDFVNRYIPRYDDQDTLLNEDEGRQIVGDQYAGFHTAMYTGENDGRDPVLIDIQKTAGTVRTMRLSDYLKIDRYQVLYKIKRLIL